MTEKRNSPSEVLQQSEARLRRAELASRTGNWEIHLDSKVIHASEGAMELYGMDADQFEYEAIKNIALPEYRSLLDAEFKNLIENAVIQMIEEDIQETVDILMDATTDRLVLVNTPDY